MRMFVILFILGLFLVVVFLYVRGVFTTGGAYESTKHGGGIVDGIDFSGVDRGVNPDYTGGQYFNTPEAGYTSQGSVPTVMRLMPPLVVLSRLLQPVGIRGPILISSSKTMEGLRTIRSFAGTIMNIWPLMGSLLVTVTGGSGMASGLVPSLHQGPASRIALRASSIPVPDWRGGTWGLEAMYNY